jgi:hypothetical protein
LVTCQTCLRRIQPSNDVDVLTIKEDGTTIDYNGDTYTKVLHNGLPAGLTISRDERLLNWHGDNYVRQTPVTANEEESTPETINDLFTEVLVLRLREALEASAGSDTGVEVAKQIRTLSDAAVMVDMQGIGSRLVPVSKEGNI